MTCEQVDELLGAYALGAVEDDEREAIEAHLTSCARHQEATELRVVALALGALSPEREPSDELESRIRRSAAGAPPAAGSRQGAGRPGLFVRWPVAAVAAVLVLAAGVAGVSALMEWQDEPAAVVHHYESGDAWMQVERLDADEVTVTMAGLEPQPSTQAYQLWAVRDGAWLSVGVCNTDSNSWWEGEFPFELHEQDRLVLTIEPAGGSPRPSDTRVLGFRPRP